MIEGKYMDDDVIGVLLKQKVRNLYNAKYQKTDSNWYYLLKDDYIKDTGMRPTYSGWILRATGYMYRKGSPYRYAEGLPQLRLCLHDAIINAYLIIDETIEILELYRQCPPKRLKDTQMAELEKCECVSFVMTIAPAINIDRKKWVLW